MHSTRRASQDGINAPGKSAAVHAATKTAISDT
jgi:hypothetical protein